jgi:hypothetical protein
MPPGVPPLVLFTTLARDARLFERFRGGGLLDKGHLTLRQREIVIDRVTAQCRSDMNGAFTSAWDSTTRCSAHWPSTAATIHAGRVRSARSSAPATNCMRRPICPTKRGATCGGT